MASRPGGGGAVVVRRMLEGGGGGCSDEAVAMLPRGGRAADKTMRGVRAEGAARGELEADDSTREGGADNVKQEGGARPYNTTRGWGRTRLIGGSGDEGAGDSIGGSWSSEVGRAPPSMPGTAPPVMVPTPGEVDDANDAPMRSAVGGLRRQGWGRLSV